MSKNFFRRIIESASIDKFFNTSNDSEDKSHDFERAKDVLFSSKNSTQLISAVKYINNFNKKHKIGEKSPEFIYFDKMINIMRTKLRSRNVKIDDDLSEGERMNPNFKNRIKESEEFDWIKDIEPPNLDFDFDGKECWVDVSKIDREGRRKIVNYIKKTLPNYKEFEYDLFGHISRGDYKGIIIHCASDLNDFEPEENLLCSANSSYEDDYEIDNPYADISKSIYIDGQDILDYISVVDEEEEELEESLEWSDKDTPFDEKDKSFESDPSWKNDEDWSLNPERSYWKQGDAGGSGGGDMNESDELDWIKNVEPDPLTASPDVFFRSDDDMFYTLDQLGHDSTNMTEMTMAELAINYGYRWSEEHEGWYHRDEVADFTKGNYPKGVRRGLDESDELQWIKDVPDTVPPIERRNKIPLKDFLVDVMKADVDLLHHFISEDTIGPTTEYMRTGNGGEGFTPEDWDNFGYDEWSNDGHWVDNHEWREDPQIWQSEIRESMELTDGDWKMVEWDTLDYDLEQGSHMDRMVFKRKSDGAYFALNFSGSHYDGIDSWNEELYQVFPKQITRFIYESDLIKKIIKEEVEDIDIAYEDKNLVVIHPKTREASCRYGSDTQWCTAAEGGESFNQYDSSGNLYYYLWKFKMPPQLQNFQKIARLINYGKEYGETGEFFLFNDETMTPHDILFNVLQGKEKGGSFTYPTKLKPLYESWERALIAVDTHYAKSGLHKTPSEYQDDEDFGYDEDYGYDDGYY